MTYPVDITLSIDMENMTLRQLDMLIQSWRDDVAYNKGRVLNTLVVGPGLIRKNEND